MFAGAFQGKRVWVSGHTGFKGAWLSLWLLRLGAEVSGFSLAPPTSPSLFEQLGLAARLRHEPGDVRDSEAVFRSLDESKPDFVFHLAAQPLVRLSYEEPKLTFETNVLGTVNVLDALRRLARPCACVVVTTDKVYENREWVHAYRETDRLGGHDPYSGSKAAAELVVSSYRDSFFSGPQSAVRVAAARAGNVIGGGDWAADRIVPDCVRALRENRPIEVRNPHSTRPWQHVLEPLSGYLWLASQLGRGNCSGAFNFGPEPESNRTVAELVSEILRHWPGAWKDCSGPGAVHEASLLNLATDKARHELGWRPVWSFARTVEETIRWYWDEAEPSEPLAERSLRQIQAYEEQATAAGLRWALT